MTGTQDTGCAGTQCPICGGYKVSSYEAVKVRSANASIPNCPVCTCPLPKDPITDKQAALNIISTFESNKNTTSVFKNIPKEDFVNDLKQIILNPKENIDQKSDGTCGAAVLMKFLVDQNPLTFTQLALGIYLKGTYTKNGLTISATQNMMNNAVVNLSEVNTK